MLHFYSTYLLDVLNVNHIHILYFEDLKKQFLSLSCSRVMSHESELQFVIKCYSIKYLFSSPRRGGGGLEKDTCQGMALFTFSDFIQTKSVDYLRSLVTGNSF